MNNKEIFGRFINDILKVKDFELEFYNVGKDNVTCVVKSNIGNFVIQQLGNISELQKEIIDEVIFFGYKNGLSLAGKKFDKRFYEFEGKTFQIMDALAGKNFDYDDFDIIKLEKVVSYLAIFHNLYSTGEFKKFEGGTNKYKDLFYFIDLAKEFNKKNNKHQELLEKILELSEGLETVDGLRRGIIHGDPILRNFLFDESKNILGLIDYEMITYDDLLWDFVDHIRGYMKYYDFKKEDFIKLKTAYERIRPFTDLEKSNIKNYLKMIILNTTTRYFLALFENSGFSNSKIGTTHENIERGFAEFKKVDSFFM